MGTKSDLQPMCRVGDLDHSVLNGMAPSDSVPQDSGNLVKEEVERPGKPEGTEDTKGKSLNASGPRTYELIETVTARTGPARVCTRWCPRTKRSGYTF